MKNYSNPKKRFNGRFLNITATLAFVISCGLFFAQAQTRSLQEQIKQQQSQYERLNRQELIRNITTGVIKLINKGEKHEGKLANKLNLFGQLPSAPPLSALLSPSPVLNNTFHPNPAVVVTSTLPSIQPLGLPNNSVPNGNLSPTNSGLQAIHSLSVAGNLGNGVFIVKDAAGLYYAVQIANAPSVQGRSRTVKRRVARR